MKHPIHQFVHTLSYGDAISGEVLALQRVFRSAGIVSEIYCINVHPKLKGQAHDYREFSSREGAGFSGEVIHHYSLGSPLNALYLELTSARRTLVFHNLTPSHWFDGINPRIVEDIESGKRELPGLLRVSHRVLADSLYNASELAELGFQAEVLELPVDPARWDLPSNPGIAQLLQSKPAIDVLHVGRL
ncbi:MAG: hypothetical protein KDD53_11175, partial [Bdellovibrionales bacterium]|nr:hypothetical protein [Bdellovibrionales bacterium]